MATISSAVLSMVQASIRKSTNQINASVLNLASGVKSNANIADFSMGTLLKNQASTLTTANLNAANGKSMLDTAKGALDEIIDLLNQQKTLAVKAQDDTLTDNERANLNTEFAALTTEIDRLVSDTKFNNKVLLDGSISGTAKQTTKTGQSTENYTLIQTSDFALSGTVASGELLTASTFSAVASSSIGDVKGSVVLDFSTVGGAVTNAVISIGGNDITFGAGQTTRATVAAAFVAAAEASTNNTVRSFVYTDNADGTVTVTGADAGTGVNATTFNMTNDGGNITAITLGGDTIDGANESISSATTSTAGTVKAPASTTYDENLQGAFSNFIATLDTTGTQNTTTFKVDINNTTYTSNAVTLFGTGGYNSKGNTIKNGQVITFTNTNGPKDGSNVLTDNGFTLTVGATDITIAGADVNAFTADLNATAAGFQTQLTSNRITQNRDIILSQTNATGGDFEVADAVSTVFDGIESFDAVGVNAKKDISITTDNFSDDGGAGAFGAFAFDSSTHKLTTTIDGVTYTADLSENSSGGGTDGGFDTTGGGGAAYNTSTQVLTPGSGVIIFATASTTDGRQLRLNLQNVEATTINLGTTAEAKVVTDALDKIFNVDESSSLTFQVGTASTDTIAVAVDRAGTADIYKDDQDITQTLSIATDAGADEAVEVIDNAIENILTIAASVNGGITSFESAIASNNTTITNVQAASDNLLLTDYAAESTLYAQSKLEYQSAINVLAAENTRLSTIAALLTNA